MLLRGLAILSFQCIMALCVSYYQQFNLSTKSRPTSSAPDFDAIHFFFTNLKVARIKTGDCLLVALSSHQNTTRWCMVHTQQACNDKGIASKLPPFRQSCCRDQLTPLVIALSLLGSLALIRHRAKTA
jgi:hypothetical protein